jgi:small neutral amino acid transporter SnatA (MarC family)
MFTILNPIGNVAISAGTVSNRSTADRVSVAIKSSIAVAVIHKLVWGRPIDDLSSMAVKFSSLQSGAPVSISRL